MNTDDIAVLVLFGQVVQVDDARNSRSDQPRKTEETVDQVECTVQEKIPVVRIAVLQLVSGVVYQMPRDTVVEVKEDERKQSRSSRHEGDIALSIEVTELGEPRTNSGALSLIQTVIREVCITLSGTASKCGFEVIRDIEASGRDIRETKSLHDRPDDNSSRDGKVMNKVTNGLVAEEGGGLESTKEENSGGGTETDDDTEKSSLVHAVDAFHSCFFGFLALIFMELIGRVQVAEETTGSKGATQCVEHKDRHNQKSKNVVEEAGGKFDVAGYIKEGHNRSVNTRPDRDPSIERKEGDFQVFSHVVKNLGHDQDGTGRTDNDEGHTTEKGKSTANPRSGNHGLKWTDIVVHIVRVHSTKGECRGDNGDVHQQRHRDRLGVEVGHSFDPVRTDRTLEISNHTRSPRLGRVCGSRTDTMLDNFRLRNRRHATTINIRRLTELHLPGIGDEILVGDSALGAITSITTFRSHG